MIWGNKNDKNFEKIIEIFIIVAAINIDVIDGRDSEQQDSFMAVVFFQRKNNLQDSVELGNYAAVFTVIWDICIGH